MAAVSYTITAAGTLESVTAGTNAPSAGVVELRIDQTTTTITDNGSTRALKKGEVYAILKVLEQYLIRDTAVVE